LVFADPVVALVRSANGSMVVASEAPHRVAEIRPLERSDLEASTALFELALGSGVRAADPAKVSLFERTFLDNPWVDPELPSLVATDEHGRIIGFIGAEVRRMRFGDRAVRAVWCQNFVVDPEARRLGLGAILLRRMLKGPQDAILTDNGSETVREMWVRLGGHMLELKGVHWVRLFRPWRIAAQVAAPRARPRLRTAVGRLAVALDAATEAAAARYLEPRPVEDTVVELTPRSLLEALPTMTRHLTLYPDYDEPYLEWLFQELARVRSRGQLVAHLVCDRSGQPLGWYLYYLRPGWRSEVLQLVADQRSVGRVLDHLLFHAHRHGSAAVRGRLEPGHVETIVSRGCLLWHRGGALAHSRDPELLCALRSDTSLATRLEGEWWTDALV
jgi:GNAT superfamily N-acetyltransferase